MGQSSQTVRPTMAELASVFFRIGVLSFGGAAGQIAMMHRMIVEERRWLDETRYLHALNYCMLLPGPEAQQLAAYIGWLAHGVRGGLVAGALFVAPGAVLMVGLALLYTYGAGLTLVDGVFYGVKAAVLAIVVGALKKIAGRGLKSAPLHALAAAAFAALLLLDLPFPLIVGAAALAGALMARLAPDAVGVATAVAPEPPAPAGRDAAALRAAGWCLLAWWAPIGLAALWLGAGHLLVEVGLFFSKLAVLTFGGAYAVLAWLSQEAVRNGWVTAAEMIDGLGLAETTPGPTILVNQFVAHLAGMRAGGLGLALAAAAMAVWATFAPSFLWIFAGAPYVESLRRMRGLTGALAGVTAAVVGVIAFVALWFALNVLFAQAGWTQLGPLRLPAVALGSLDPAALVLTALAFYLTFRRKWGVAQVVGLLAALGVARQVLLG